MALPWSAPGYGQGIFPSQAPFFIPDKVDPHLIALITAQREQRQKEIAGNIQGALSGLGQIMKQHQQDAIASQLLAGSAPQAEAFTPAGEATPTGTPSAALSPDEIAQNKALGYPTEQLMTPTQTYAARDFLAKQQMEDVMNAAKIAHLNRLGYGVGGGAGGGEPAIWTDPVSNERYVRGPSGGLHKLGSGTSDTNLIQSSLERNLATQGETAQNFLKYYDQPGMVTYWNKDYSKQLSTEEAAKDPDARAVLPNSASMKLGDYQKLQRRAEAVRDTTSTAGAVGGAGLNNRANQIKADYQSGKLTRDEALAQLRANGLQ
jgi:hypothetical protein